MPVRGVGPWRAGAGLALALFGGVLGSGAAQGQSAAGAYTTGYRWDGERHLVGEIAAPAYPAAPGTGPYLATRYSYDAAGQLVRVETGALAAWKSESVQPQDWGADFAVVKQTDYTYDVAGYKVLEQVRSQPDGTVRTQTQFSFDADGRAECSAVRMDPAQFAVTTTSPCVPQAPTSPAPDRVTRTIYDAAGQVLQVRRAVGTSFEQAYATYSYTANGKQQQVVDANGNQARFDYDGFDRLKTWTFPSTIRPTAFNPASPKTALDTAGTPNGADTESYDYDAGNNRTSLKRRDGSTLTYSYDAVGRLMVKTVPDRADLALTHVRDVYYSYDRRGLQLAARFDSVAGADGIVSGYDRAGRLIASTQLFDGAGRTLNFCYDANSNRTRMAFVGASTNGCVAGAWTGNVTYGYDGLNRPASVLRENAAPIASFAYDPATGWRRSQSGGAATSFEYDRIGRLSALTHTPTGAAANLTTRWDFGYNPASQIEQTTRSNDTLAWIGAADVSRSYTTNGLNQYTAAGPAAFCYDRNGNLTADGSSVYRYDVENRLVEKRAQGANNTNCAALSYAGALQARLRYDPLGRLYEVTASTGAITRFLYDGDALVAEYDGGGNLLRRYVHGPDAKADDPLAWYEGSAFAGPNERLLKANWQGSIVLVTDSTGGTVIGVNRYDAFGIPQGTTDAGGTIQSTNTGRFQYTGQAWLAELGMYHYKARIYSPTLGRFLQTDPIGYDDQINLYAYVRNDPMNGVDPTGNAELDLNVGSVRLKVDLTLTKASGSVETQSTKVEGSIGERTISGSVKTNNTELKGVVGLDNGASVETKSIKLAVGAYDSGTFKDLKARSQPGDGLDIHHAPQKHAAQQVIPGYDKATGSSIALPTAEHQAIPTMRGQVNMSPRALLAQATRELRNLTNATNSQIQSWLKSTKDQYGIK